MVARLTASQMQITPATDPGMLLGDSGAMKDLVSQLIDIRKQDVRTGNTEPFTATVQFDSDAAGLIAQGQIRTAFLDTIGQNQASGMVQTIADSNFTGGKVPSGQIPVLRAWGVTIECDFTATSLDIQRVGANIAQIMNLRKTPVQMGSIRDWPDLLAPRGTGGGNSTFGMIPFTPPIVLLPLQDFSVTAQVVRPIQLSVAQVVAVRLHFRAQSVTSYDPLVLGKS